MLRSLEEFGVGDSSVPVGRWVCSTTNAIVTGHDEFFLFFVCFCRELSFATWCCCI